MEKRSGVAASWKVVFLFLVLTTGLGVYFCSSSRQYFAFEPKDRPIPPMISNRRKVSTVNCEALIRDDKEERDKVMDLMKTERSAVKSGSDYVNMTSNCDTFKKTRGYILDSSTPEEDSFPIAFSMLMYKDIEQAERLLRAIYRPQNYYCIHVDIKADNSVKLGMKAIVSCFHNVFLAPRMLDVIWGTYSVLEADLICMRTLWSRTNWSYFINLTGQEFPLKTNRELVKILTAYNGANDIDGVINSTNYLSRWRQAGKPAPHGLCPAKGSVHIVASRGYVDYLLHNKTAQDLLEWVKHTTIPDETFFATLNHNPHLRVPGSYNGNQGIKKPFLARYKIWLANPFRLRCHGRFVHEICIFGIGDLPLLTSRPELFANKFYWGYQPYTLDCLEEWHHNKTRDDFLYAMSFNTTYYRELDFVQNSIIQS